MKDKKSIAKRVRGAFQLSGILVESDLLELRGHGELTVRTCERILHYSETEIRLMLCDHNLKIVGGGLYCSSYMGGTVRVDGDICGIEISKRGDN